MKPEKMRSLMIKGLEEESTAGFFGAHQGRLTCKKIEKDGIEMSDRQEMRSLLVEDDNDKYLLHFVDNIKKDTFCGFWKVTSSPNKEIPAIPDVKFKWIGYTEV